MGSECKLRDDVEFDDGQMLLLKGFNDALWDISQSGGAISNFLNSLDVVYRRGSITLLCNNDDRFTLRVDFDSRYEYHSVHAYLGGAPQPYSVKSVSSVAAIVIHYLDWAGVAGGPHSQVRALIENQSNVISESGAIKGRKLAMYSKIPVSGLHSLAERYGYGEWKYGDARNWEAGLPWTTHIDAMMRHLAAWQAGEDLDPDCPFDSTHIAAVLYHAMSLEHYMAHPEIYSKYDDRRKYDPPVHSDLNKLED